MAAGDFLAATLSVHDRALASLILPIGLVGMDFALTVSSITATAVNTVEVHYAGITSASKPAARLLFHPRSGRQRRDRVSRPADEFTPELSISGLSAGARAAAGQVAAEGRPPRRRLGAAVVPARRRGFRRPGDRSDSHGSTSTASTFAAPAFE
jgi:hypothetical protein